MSLVQCLVDGFLYEIVLFLAPRTGRLPSPTLSSQLLGVPVASQPPSQPQPPPASPPASQPAAIQCARNRIQSSSKLPKSPSKLPKSPSNLPKPPKTNGFHRFLLCQPGRLPHPFWMPEAPKVPPSDLQRQSRSSQAHPKCSLEAPQVTPNTPIWTHCARSEPNLNPEAPKIHHKTPKMLPEAVKIHQKPPKILPK